MHPQLIKTQSNTMPFIDWLHKFYCLKLCQTWYVWIISRLKVKYELPRKNLNQELIYLASYRLIYTHMHACLRLFEQMLMWCCACELVLSHEVKTLYRILKWHKWRNLSIIDINGLISKKNPCKISIYACTHALTWSRSQYNSFQG